MRKIRNKTSSCLGIFSRNLRFGRTANRVALAPEPPARHRGQTRVSTDFSSLFPRFPRFCRDRLPPNFFEIRILFFIFPEIGHGLFNSEFMMHSPIVIGHRFHCFGDWTSPQPEIGQEMSLAPPVHPSSIFLQTQKTCRMQCNLSKVMPRASSWCVHQCHETLYRHPL